jgi:hypothetical protein
MKFWNLEDESTNDVIFKTDEMQIFNEKYLEGSKVSLIYDAIVIKSTRTLATATK